MQAVGITPNLMFHYKLWAGPKSTGRVFDYTLNNADGLMVGSGIKPAYPGFEFNGVDDYINTRKSFEVLFRSSFGIMLWIKPDEGKPAEMQISFGNKDGTRRNGVTIQLKETGQIQFVYDADNNSAVNLSTGTIFRAGPASNWVHLACTIDQVIGSSLYIDGELNRVVSMAGVDQSDYVNIQPIYVGSRNTGGDSITNFFDGKIDDVRVYNALPMAQEIRNVYNLTRGRYGT